MWKTAGSTGTPESSSRLTLSCLVARMVGGKGQRARARMKAATYSGCGVMMSRQVTGRRLIWMRMMRWTSRPCLWQSLIWTAGLRMALPSSCATDLSLVCHVHYFSMVYIVNHRESVWQSLCSLRIALSAKTYAELRGIHFQGLFNG